MAATKIVVFDLNEDLHDKRALHVKGPDPIEEHKTFIFDPYDFDDKNLAWKIEDYLLDEAGLL